MNNESMVYGSMVLGSHRFRFGPDSDGFMLENNFKPKSTLVTLGSSLLIRSNFLVLKLIVFYAYVQICPFTYHQSFKENHVFCLMNSKRFLSLSRVGQGIIKTATKTETHNGTCNFSRCVVTVTLCTKR